METTDAFRGLTCLACDAALDADRHATYCPDCGGILDAQFDYPAVALEREDLTGTPDGMARYESLLPFPASVIPNIHEGGTPLVDCPSLADEMGVGSVYVKDEGRNPTGAAVDRGMALAVAAAAMQGASDVALPTTGDSGQAAAAYASRAGLAVHAFVPSRASFVNKAMINIHGGDMRVCEGRYADAVEAYEEWIPEKDWQPVGAMTPYRREGLKTILFELAEQLEWTLPDAVVVPVGHGELLLGIEKAAREFRELGLTDDVPALYAAQAEGCAPIADAWTDGRDAPEPVEYPDTVVGELEIADPRAGVEILDAIDRSGGGAVAPDDDDILDSAAAVAQQEGVEVGLTGGAAAAGAWALAEDGTFDDDATVVVLNGTAGNKRADVVRSRLMGMGI